MNVASRHRAGSVEAALLGACLLAASVALLAQERAPPGTELAQFAARRYPQPIRVGDLLNRTVLEPVESRNVLGHVRDVVRLGDDHIDLVVDYGGVFGWGTRPIAVPIEAMVLLGSELEILDFTPEQLRDFPTFAASTGTKLAQGDIVHMGLAHPSH